MKTNKKNNKSSVELKPYYRDGKRVVDMVEAPGFRPVTQIYVCGYQLLALDVNDGWQIDSVEYDVKATAAAEIDEFTIHLRRKDGLAE